MKISRRHGLLGVLVSAFLFMPVVWAQNSGTIKPLNLSVPPDTVYGSVSSGAPIAGVMPLSLDDAIRRGLQTNLQTTLVKQDQRIVSGERLEAI
ncbi:MAG TPA: hypothetical protein VE195_01305, partial [Acidobacteriaceae bacterium]|nr:hypothetical protein [Acidobacteriaceae bacterium]